MKTKSNKNNLQEFLIIDNVLHIITHIREDGKIYFELPDNPDITYTTNENQIKDLNWTLLNFTTLEEANKSIIK